MALLIWVISVVLLSFITLIVTTWLCNITDSSNSLIHNNKYNKYKIYYDASCDLYYCKMVTNYLLGIIPIWRRSNIQYHQDLKIQFIIYGMKIIQKLYGLR